MFKKSNSNLHNKKILENICSSAIEFPVLPYDQNYNSPSCEYTESVVNTYKITTGLIKKDMKQNLNEEKTIETTSSERTNEKKSSNDHFWRANIEFGFLNKFFNLSGSASGGGDYHNSNKDVLKTEEKTLNSNTYVEVVSLENTFDLSNTNENTNKVEKKIFFPMQPIKVPANKKIKTEVVVNKTIDSIYIKIKQDIYGEISAEIINENKIKIPFKISIKEIMQKLKQYDLLPKEITIKSNGDNITFNGKMLLAETKSGLNAKLNIKKY